MPKLAFVHCCTSLAGGGEGDWQGTPGRIQLAEGLPWSSNPQDAATSKHHQDLSGEKNANKEKTFWEVFTRGQTCSQNCQCRQTFFWFCYLCCMSKFLSPFLNCLPTTSMGCCKEVSMHWPVRLYLSTKTATGRKGLNNVVTSVGLKTVSVSNHAICSKVQNWTICQLSFALLNNMPWS